MLKPSGKRTEEKVALTPEEGALLLKRVKDVRARTFLLIALHAGMRRGEIIGLLREDIDFEKKVLFPTKPKSAKPSKIRLNPCGPMV